MLAVQKENLVIPVCLEYLLLLLFTALVQDFLISHLGSLRFLQTLSLPPHSWEQIAGEGDGSYCGI